VLLIPVIALIALLQQDRLAGHTKKVAWIALVLLPIATLFTGEGLLSERASEYLHAIGTSTWAMVVLYVATAMALWQKRGTSSEERGGATS
jgi:hypothetical protein